MISNSPNIIEIQVQETISVELTEADKIALFVMLRKSNPRCKINAIQYIKARFNLPLKYAKDVADHIDNYLWEK